MKPADIGKRLIAFIIDSFVLSAIMNAVIVPFYCCMWIPLGLFDEKSSRITAGDSLAILLMCAVFALLIAVSLGISYAYYVWYPVKKWNGATLGKKAMNMHVVKVDGTPVTQGQLFIREFIGKAISGLVFYLGYIWILIDDRAQGWHDKIVDTMVVEMEEKK